jgi:hypothetical protein
MCLGACLDMLASRSVLWGLKPDLLAVAVRTIKTVK